MSAPAGKWWDVEVATEGREVYRVRAETAEEAEEVYYAEESPEPILSEVTSVGPVVWVTEVCG